jgi:hypothetical protein
MSPPFETIEEPLAIKIPPCEALSESDQSVTGPPLDCNALLISRFAVDFKVIGATVLVFAVSAAPVVRSPAVAVTEIPPVPADVIAPVPENIVLVTTTAPEALRVAAPE